MIKVALIGTHGTYKSTECHVLVGALRRNNINAEYFEEVAREANRIGLPLNEKTTLEAQTWIFHKQIANEIGASAIPGIQVGVFDRSVFDNYMYLIRRFGKQPIIDEFVTSHSRTYNPLFLIPIPKKGLTDDGVRSVNPLFQKEIDDLVRKELFLRGIPFVEYRGVESALEIITRNLKEQNGKL
ncbi:MAG: AAA family ATPase [Candidatus Pacearchaeota archaeon]|nr:AAA family ATPase [Candidatus Pacearchaeota archaeon]